MENEIIEVKHENVALGSLMTQSPKDVIVVATSIADELAKIIKQKNLYKHIGNKDYVVVEGWNTLGAMLGVTAREREVHQIENGWESYVELIRVSDGVVMGGASAICTRLENNWKSRDEFAVRSMTITRATGKAFRLSFSWIMALAGYEPTPAEEMDGIIEGSFKDAPEKKQESKQKQNKAGVLNNKSLAKFIKPLVDNKLASNGYEAVGILNKSSRITDDLTEEKVLAWATKYQKERSNGADSDLASEVADAELFGE